MQRGIVEKSRIIVAHKADTGSAGRHYVILSIKIFKEFRAYIPCFIPEPRIECRLTATGLVAVVRDLRTRLFQHAHHIEGCLRIQLVYKTWYEKLNCQNAVGCLKD